MSGNTEFTLGSNFTVHINNRPDIADGLHWLAEKYGIVNKADLLARMIQVCRNAEATVKKSEKAPSKPQDGFFASIDPMDRELVKQMQMDLWRDKKIKNDGILSYFVNLHKRLQDKNMFLVKPPKGVTRTLLETTEPLIDAGEVSSEGQYISIVLRDHFKEQKKAAQKVPPKEEATPPKAEKAAKEEKPKKSFWDNW